MNFWKILRREAWQTFVLLIIILPIITILGLISEWLTGNTWPGALAFLAAFVLICAYTKWKDERTTGDVAK